MNRNAVRGKTTSIGLGSYERKIGRLLKINRRWQGGGSRGRTSGRDRFITKEKRKRAYKGDTQKERRGGSVKARPNEQGIFRK